MKRFLVILTILSLCGCARKEFAREESVVVETSQIEAKVLDLTFMNANMVYAEVVNMLEKPYEYRAKRVRVNGLFVTRQENGETKCACLILDATECCSQGIEFICKDMVYPDDYPEPGAEITVEGVFDYYSDGTSINLRLKDAVFS